MEEEEREILIKSIGWIKKNQQANTEDLPEDLLEEWIDENYEGEIESSGELAMSVFMTALMEKKGKKGEFKIKESELIEQYDLWQTKLNLQSMVNSGMVKLGKPLGLFSFSKNEEIEVIDVKQAEKWEAPVPSFNMKEEGASNKEEEKKQEES